MTTHIPISYIKTNNSHFCELSKIGKVVTLVSEYMGKPERVVKEKFKTEYYNLVE